MDEGVDGQNPLQKEDRLRRRGPGHRSHTTEEGQPKHIASQPRIEMGAVQGNLHMRQ